MGAPPIGQYDRNQKRLGKIADNCYEAPEPRLPMVATVARAVREHSGVEANLDGVRVKLLRAKDHVNELRSQLGPLATEATRSIVAAPDEDDPSMLVYRVTRVPDIDPVIAAIAGDIVHNLRSALDHLAWQLVLLDNGQPTDKTAFPLHGSPTNQHGNARMLTIQPGISNPQIIAAVKAMQPYTEANYGHDPRTDALGIIGRLDNIDKHRLLLTVVHALDRDQPGYWGLNEGDPSPTFQFNLASPVGQRHCRDVPLWWRDAACALRAESEAGRHDRRARRRLGAGTRHRRRVRRSASHSGT